MFLFIFSRPEHCWPFISRHIKHHYQMLGVQYLNSIRKSWLVLEACSADQVHNPPGHRLMVGVSGCAKRKKDIQHPRFPCSPLPKYWSGPTVLNFAVRMGCGAFTVVWSYDEVKARKSYSPLGRTPGTRTIRKKQKVIHSRFVRVILAQGPC